MYIAPNTNVKILRDIKLDSSYRNTAYWDSESDQYEYFADKAKYSLDAYSYQRVQRAIRVGIKAESLYDCSYLMFQNESFGDKWFYAFITDIRYVNNITSEIDFEIDLIQTWYFDMELEECFIERQHSETDEIGDNLLSEPVPLGEYEFYNEGGTGVMDKNEDAYGTNWVCMVNSVLKHTGDYFNPTVVGGVVQGAGYFCGRPDAVRRWFSDTFASLNEQQQANMTSAIVAIFMFPSALLNLSSEETDDIEDGEVIDLEDMFYLDPVEVSLEKRSVSVGSYIPRNNKLFTYPYNFLRVTDYCMHTKDYGYEYFSTDDCNFDLFASVTPNPEIGIAPKAYKMLSVAYDEGVKISDLPKGSFNTDSFLAYYAMNGAKNDMSLILNPLYGLASAIIAPTPGAGAGIVVSEMKTVADTYLNSQAMRKLGRESNGTPTSDALFNIGEKDFHFINVHVREEYARIIDDFFTKYGYSQMRVATPNFHARENYTYVKTVGASLGGNMPASAVEAIEKILDKGITFWVDADFIGDYTLSNDPLEEGD